jgi:hypothetical protein
MFTGKINPEQFLAGIDLPVVARVAEVITRNAPGRGEILRIYLDDRLSSTGEKKGQVAGK